MDKVGSESKYDDPFFDTARILLEKNLADKPNDSETFRALAAFYSSHSFVVGSTHDDFEFSMSTKYLDMAIQADPENLKAKIDFIRHLITRHMGVESKNLMSKYLSNIDDSKVDYETSRKLMGLFFRNHEMERSNKYMEMALKKAPNDDEKAFVYSSLADLNTTIDDYKKCTEYYEKSFQLNDKVAWNFGNAANCYNKIKMYDKAIELSRRAISLMDYGVAHSTLADSYVLKSEELFKNGKYKECEENLQLAKMEYPRADVFLSLVKVYLQTKQEEKAQEASKNALMAVDERYNKQWVSQNLLAITNYYKFQNQNVKRSIASEPEVKNKKLGNDK
jgi:tetratricopeptide (TPR) repeat protein